MNARTHPIAASPLRALLARIVLEFRARLAAWRQRMVEARLHAARSCALARLDAATLRDLGIARGELPSYLAETEGRAPPTRIRVLLELSSRSKWS